MSQLGVSIIMNVLNEAADIQALLNSIEHQTRRPTEVIILDAGSTDQTVAIITAWQQRCGLTVRLLIEPGVNISRGRNLAIAASRQPVIAATDGGCVLDRRWLEQIMAPLEANPDVLAVYGGTHAVGRSWLGSLFADFYNYKTHSAHITNTEHSSRSVAFRRSAWKSVGGYPEWLTLAAEDTLFFQDLDAAGRTVVERRAVVEWYHDTDTLKRLYRVHRRNTIGSGEANLWPRRYQGLIGLHLVGLAFLAATPLWWGNGLIGLAWLFGLWSRASWPVYQSNHRLSTFIGLPMVFAARDLGSCVGYVIGLGRRRRS